MNPACNTNKKRFSIIVCEAIDACNRCVLSVERREILIELLIQLQDFRKYYGSNDISLTSILDQLGSNLQKSHLSRFSLYFYKEKIRIEKLYLGPRHPGLAPTLYNIGQVYAQNEQIFEAVQCFAEAFFLLKGSNKKGKLLALILFKLGLIKYESSPIDAMKILHCSIKEQQDFLGEFHPDIAQMYLKVGKLQLKSDMKDNAVNSFLQALMIVRISRGNNNAEIGEILYNIGLYHKDKGEYVEALNSFDQSLDITKHFQCKEGMIMTLHKMFLIYENSGDIENAINMLQKIIHIVKEKVGENHICVALVLNQLCSLYKKQGMMEKSRRVSKNIGIICCMSRRLIHNSSYEFINFMIELFGYILEDSSTIVLAAAAA